MLQKAISVLFIVFITVACGEDDILFTKNLGVTSPRESSYKTCYTEKTEEVQGVFADTLLQMEYFDPHTARTNLELHLSWALYPTLTELEINRNTSQNTVGGLTQSWRLVKDGKNSKYVFSLKKVFWSDGSPITAQQVKKSLLRVFDERNAYTNLLALSIQGGLEYLRGIIKSDDIAIRVLDEHSLEIVARGDATSLIDVLSIPSFSILPFPLDNKLSDEVFSLSSPSLMGGMYQVKEIENNNIVLEKRVDEENIPKNITFFTGETQKYRDVFFGENLFEAEIAESKTSVYPHFFLGFGFPNSTATQKTLLENTTSFYNIGQEYILYDSEDSALLRGFGKTLLSNVFKNKIFPQVNNTIVKKTLHSQSIYNPTVLSPYTDVQLERARQTYKILAEPDEDDQNTFLEMIKTIDSLSVVFLESQFSHPYVQKLWSNIIKQGLQDYLEELDVRGVFTTVNDEADMTISIFSPLYNTAEGLFAEESNMYLPNDENSLTNYLVNKKILTSYESLEEINSYLQKTKQVFPLYYLPSIDLNRERIITNGSTTTKSSFVPTLRWRPLVCL